MARHHAAGEEMLRDPILAISAVEQIGADRWMKMCVNRAAVRV
jgi:hypothetical protein